MSASAESKDPSTRSAIGDSSTVGAFAPRAATPPSRASIAVSTPTTSSALAGRAAGSFASNRPSSASTSASTSALTTSLTRGGACRTCATRISIALAASNSGRPASISNIIAPSAYRSVR